MRLRKKTRKRVREIARDALVWQTADLATVPADNQSQLFRSELQRRRRLAVDGAKEMAKKELGSSLLGTLVMTLIFKLIEKYISNWIEQNLLGPHIPRDFKEAK